MNVTGTVTADDYYYSNGDSIIDVFVNIIGDTMIGDLILPSLTATTSIELNGYNVTDILDEDNMISDSNVALATQQSIKAYIDNLITSYDTGWINRSDWTNVHLGSTTTKNVDSNVTHNLDAKLSEVLVKVLISTDGTDDNSFEIPSHSHDSAGSSLETGFTVYQISANAIVVQTGEHGIDYCINSDGSTNIIDTEDYYYKIKIFKFP